MLTFHRIALVSVSLCGVTRAGSGLRLPLETADLEIHDFLSERISMPDPDLAAMAARWGADPGTAYLAAVTASLGETLFGGYIDHAAGTLTLQRAGLRDPGQAMGYALCAAQLRSMADRCGPPLPVRILPVTADLGALLRSAAPVDHNSATCPSRGTRPSIPILPEMS